ncbi:MAG: hypothetical protein HYX27_08630 [Acidobacteria bacterium]|nr:hypothetical protein [Acidobacteriota bacterium]
MSNPMRSLFALLLTVPSFAVDPSRPRVIAHEWGTFTTVAAEDGNPIQWRPFTESDLPCFVERSTRSHPKSNLTAFVRMETPVVYFYAQRPATLSVRVSFPRGRITEWYPKASSLAGGRSDNGITGGGIDWNSVEVLPGAPPEFPVAASASHYFAARATDAAPVRVNGQLEKMLFYRGVGNFDVPVEAKFGPDGRLRVRNTGKDPLPVAVYFENRRGKIGYRVARGLTGPVEWETPELAAHAETVHQELAGELVNAGLFPKEAAAMIDTWRDSWFEEGTRIIYLVPRALVDGVLPLQIEPAADAVERVFVGRVELLAPWRQTELLATASPEPLIKLGRFLEPFATQIARTRAKPLPDTVYRAAMQELFKLSSQGAGCVR